MSEYTEKQKIWTRNYINSMGEIKIRPTKEEKAKFQKASEVLGYESLNKFIIDAIKEKIERDC